MENSGNSASQVSFGVAVAELYEQLMVPMIFEPYAEALAARFATHHPGKTLEIAAGTGIVTRKLALLRPDGPIPITATDISQFMLDLGRQICPAENVAWKQADVHHLPFDDATFDTVICQFGAMFFDRAGAFREIRRVLRPKGSFVLSVWDRIETNEFADVVQTAVAELFPDDAPSFLRRTPHGHYDTDLLTRELIEAGFGRMPTVEKVKKTSRAQSAKIPARAYTQGTPMRAEIIAHGADRLEAATTVAERALIARFGGGAICGDIQAFVITACAA